MKHGQKAAAMSPAKFRDWRKSLDLKQKDAADLLGLKKRMIQYYEKGERGAKPVEIPLAIRLACYAVSLGVRDFDGETPIQDDETAAETENSAKKTAKSGQTAKSGTKDGGGAIPPAGQ